MPKDLWLKARNKDIARKSNHERHFNRKRSKALKRLKSPKRIASRFNSNSQLWFGKFKHVAICNIPRSYLFWLTDNLSKGKSSRIDGLVLFLRKYLNSYAADPPVERQKDDRRIMALVSSGPFVALDCDEECPF
jgi:uncharacterized protein (DUF3820 family)